MGIVREAALVVGRPREDFGEMGIGCIGPFIEEGSLEEFSSNYGEIVDTDIVGICLIKCCSQPEEIQPQPDNFAEACKQFRDMTGLDAKLYLTRVVW